MRWSLQAMIKDDSNHNQSNKGDFEFSLHPNGFILREHLEWEYLGDYVW